MFVLATLSACERSGDEATAQFLQPPAPDAPLPPVLAEYAKLWAAWDRQSSILLADLYPFEANLRLSDSAPPGSMDRLVAWLDASQPIVRGLVELARRPMEPFPAEPTLTDAAIDRGDHMRHPRAWMQNFVRLLAADASRAWEQGDPAGAAGRAAAIVRIGHAVVMQPEQASRLTGHRLLLHGVSKALSLADAGMLAALSPESLADLREAVAAVDPRDPARFIAEWENDARAAAAEARHTFAVPDGGRALAEYLRRNGIDGPDTQLESDPLLGSLAGALPLRSAAVTAERLSTKEIGARIDAAEVLIPQIARVVRGDAPGAEFAAAVTAIRDDPSQLARLIIAAPEAGLLNHETLMNRLSELREKLHLD